MIVRDHTSLLKSQGLLVIHCALFAANCFLPRCLQVFPLCAELGAQVRHRGFKCYPFAVPGLSILPTQLNLAQIR